MDWRKMHSVLREGEYRAMWALFDEEDVAKPACSNKPKSHDHNNTI
jgi:hypothetical protein